MSEISIIPILTSVLENISLDSECIFIDPKNEHFDLPNNNISCPVFIDSEKERFDLYNNTTSHPPLKLGSLGSSCMLRSFSEDVFDPKLVPSYIKEIKVSVYNGKKYFSYRD